VGGGGAIHGNPDTASGIYQINADGTTALIADLGAWVDEHPVANTPPEGAPNNGSFFAMVPVGDALWVVEAVNGQVLQVTAAGEVTRIADLSVRHLVPSGIAADPDGGAYVGYLTPAPYPQGSAKVSHVTPDGAVEDVWTGLTAVTAVEVGPDGALYAAELSTEMSEAEPFLTENTGRIVRQLGPDSMEEIAFGLDRPVAMRIGPDGAMYVSVPAFGSNAGSGQVVCIALDAAPAASQATPIA
ncbi:MAG: ScyD/ScyE family protein, partial [Thermomicrobiales bacterium]